METTSIHSEHKVLMEQAVKNLPPEEKVMPLADFFKVFGDSTRLKIIGIL